MNILLSPSIVVLVPIVIGLVSLFKQYTGSYWAPAVSLALGIGSSFLLPQSSLTLTILAGVIVGLTAVGLYSSTSTMVSSN